MKKVFAALLLCVLVGYCALPLVSVSSITIALENQRGRKITADGRAAFLDADGRAIVEIALDESPSWDNNIHWWAHSTHETSKLRPVDARRARSVAISAGGCAPLTLPIALESRYVPPSLAPHGGGRAYMLYEFNGTARLTCEGAE
ncbi:hypothetical protein [Dongia deserti]|uniref:hypothetical protein n=1 Tax=Dongia deserti TaxID=2268030 RepID=UPI000E646880|nr:hypothetical protein [Dongia deserti]